MANEVSKDDLEISDFDVIDYLNSAEEIATYLTILFENYPSDEPYLRDALGSVLRAGIALAEDSTELAGLLAQLEENDGAIPASVLFNLASALKLQVSFQTK